MTTEPEKTMDEVIRSDGRYPPEAYGFLHESLARAIKSAHGVDIPGAGGQHHVSGRQICEAARDLAIERWGMLAEVVLGRWNIRGTIDLGNMVYLLINHGMWRKTEQDSLEDFRDVFDFGSALLPAMDFELKE